MSTLEITPNLAAEAWGDEVPRVPWEAPPAEQAASGAGAVAEPAAEVSGAAVLDEAAAFLKRFWVAPCPEAIWAMTLWAASCHVTDKDGELASYSTARLAFVSDEPGSGKTMALELLELLCPRAIRCTDPTAPALLKLIAEQKATLMIDEVDLLFGAGQAAKAVRAVLNSGYRRGAQVARVNGPQSTFAPVALAGLASSFMANPTLGPTRERCIVVHCRKPPAGMRPERYREQLHEGLGKMCAAALEAWVQPNVLEIVTEWPEFPGGIDARQEDVWQPLLAVANVAGGHWPDRARAACLAFTQGQREAGPELPPRLRLLRDIRAVWPAGSGSLGTRQLIGALFALPGAPWSSMWSEVGMARELPGLLGIQPGRVEVDGREKQGYWLTDMEPLWAEIPSAGEGV